MMETPMLPFPLTPGLAGECERALQEHIQVALKNLLMELRQGTLTLDKAACGLGRIDGYYVCVQALVDYVRSLQPDEPQPRIYR